jgi:hypothetical protein
MATPAYLLEILIEEIEPLHAAAMHREAQVAMIPHTKPETRRAMLADWALQSRPLVQINAPPVTPDPEAAKAFFAAMNARTAKPPEESQVP